MATSDTDVRVATNALRIENLSKTFASQKALDSVSFSVQRGKITALLGMNGSGKSTLIKVLAGVYQPDDGASLTIGDTEARLPMTPRTAHEAGLRFLHQDVGLVDSLTIADNFAFVDRFRSPGLLGPINQRRQHEHVAATLAKFGVSVHPGTLVAQLNPTLRTMVGLARAFQDEEESGVAAFAKNVVVLDEPTASLPVEEVDTILTSLEELKANGGTVIYVSHRTEEVKRIADQLVILRDGKLVADEPIADMTVDDIVSRVVGKRLEKTRLPRQSEREGGVVLSARGISGPRLREVDLDVRSGEIVGIAGLVGCGRSELVRILAGAQKPLMGEMQLDGKPYRPDSPATAISRGVACVPQERRREGAVLSMTVRENITLGRLKAFAKNGMLDGRKEREGALRLIEQFAVKPPAPSQLIGLLSGGNQQKVVVARAAGYGGTALLLDEPSQGVDALAKQEIANIVRSLAADGLAVVLASTDFEEFVGLCDRVLILDRGRLVAEATGLDISEEHLALLCAQHGSTNGAAA
ncbi:sugar ABC transporter ATP-binding protein [Arthrobacter sp. NPDC056493]|uniref:sugar ABC transporter ATP-binding protein n=1 Tax=Arthrobacter sp. NPDC056493 TaxID=3345839 RepID=UPI0036703485